MGIAVIIGLFIVGIALFETHRRGRLDNDTLQALVAIITIVGVLGGIIQFIIPLATEDESTPIPTPSIEIAISSSETLVPATEVPAPATEAPASVTETPVPATHTPAPTTHTPPPATEAPIGPANTSVPAPEAPSGLTNTPIPATITPPPSIEIAISSSETLVPATEVPAPATETPITATQTPITATQTPIPATQTPPPATEAPIPSSQTPIPATHTPPPATEAPIVPTNTSGGTDGPVATVTLPPLPTMVQVYVPEGHFLMGSVPGDGETYDNEIPQRSVYLDAFWIDQVEVTNSMYAACVTAGECSPPSSNGSYTRDRYFNDPEYSNYPVIYVSWNDANTYCRWAGRRLPTEAEWEKAARGTDGKTYPWGNDAPTDNRLNFNHNVGDTTEVGSYPNGASPYGALDMAGNVWEWIADWYDPKYYNYAPSENPIGPDNGTLRAVRGGSWNFIDIRWVRALGRSRGNPTIRDVDSGFRCARSP